jgi:hypothetical protein
LSLPKPARKIEIPGLRQEAHPGMTVKSIRFRLVRFLAGLHEIETVFDLAEQAREILLLL